MGREATITYEQIAAVADAMKVEGLKPTWGRLRKRKIKHAKPVAAVATA